MNKIRYVADFEVSVYCRYRAIGGPRGRWDTMHHHYDDHHDGVWGQECVNLKEDGGKVGRMHVETLHTRSPFSAFFSGPHIPRPRYYTLEY